MEMSMSEHDSTYFNKANIFNAYSQIISFFVLFFDTSTLETDTDKWILA